MPAVELALDEPPDAYAGADAVWCGADAEGAAEPEPPELDPPPQPATAIATTASMPEPAAVNRDFRMVVPISRGTPAGWLAWSLVAVSGCPDLPRPGP